MATADQRAQRRRPRATSSKARFWRRATATCCARAGSGRIPTTARAARWSRTTWTPGTIRGVDVGGLTLASVVFIPGNVLAGNWKQLLYVDDRASDEQLDALVDAFSGKLGGPLADLAQLIGEQLGVVRAPITHEVGRGRRGTLRVGDDTVVAEMEPYRGPDGSITTLNNSIFSTVPGCPGLGREGVEVRGQHARAGLDVRVRGSQRDPVRLEDRLPRRRGLTVSRLAAPPLGGVPRPVLVGIGLSWAAAIARRGDRLGRRRAPRLAAGGRARLRARPPAVPARVAGDDRGDDAAVEPAAGADVLGGDARAWPSAAGRWPPSSAATRWCGRRSGRWRSRSTRACTPRVAASPWVERHDWAIGAVGAAAGGRVPVLLAEGRLPAGVPAPGLVPAPALPARPGRRAGAGRAPRRVLRGLLLGADAGDVRRRRGQPDLDGGPDRADGPREDAPEGRKAVPVTGVVLLARLDAAAVRGVHERGDLPRAYTSRAAGRSATW